MVHKLEITSIRKTNDGSCVVQLDGYDNTKDAKLVYPLSLFESIRTDDKFEVIITHFPRLAPSADFDVPPTTVPTSVEPVTDPSILAKIKSFVTGG
jgi:hypothetical protein